MSASNLTAKVRSLKTYGQILKYMCFLWYSYTSLVVPGVAEDGIWQNVLISSLDENKTPIKKNIRIWNPHPTVYKTFDWRPEGNKEVETGPNGSIQGSGTLTWNDLAYNPIGPKYSGDLKNGRADGRGQSQDLDGSEYVGDWKDGTPNGHGIITFSNGDQYQGEVINGIPSGLGKYVAADGTAYEGAFTNGVRNGSGILTNNDGASFQAVYRAGHEVSGSIVHEPDADVDLIGSEAAQIRLFVDKPKNRKFADGDPDTPSFVYDSNTVSRTLDLHLSSDSIAGAWRNAAPLIRVGQVGHIYSAEQFSPANLRADIVPINSSTLTIDKLYLEATSTIDRRPYLEVHGSEAIDGCGELNRSYDPSITFVNYGWSAALRA